MMSFLTYISVQKQFLLFALRNLRWNPNIRRHSYSARPNKQQINNRPGRLTLSSLSGIPVFQISDKMKNVLDVMTLQQHIETSKTQSLKAIDYRKINKPGLVPMYVFECAAKLKMKPLTAACASIIYHRFNKEVKSNGYDEFLIATSSLYLAGKIKDDDNVKIRDVINVAYSTLNRGTSPLDLNDEYWAIRDAIVQAELLITRTLGFDLNIELAHKYLLYYMKTLQDWMGPDVWNAVPIAKVAASFLQDFHHSPNVLKHKSTHLAIGCLSLALQTYGVQIPLTDESVESSMWYKPLVQDFTREKQWEIVEDMIEVYRNEALLKSH